MTLDDEKKATQDRADAEDAAIAISVALSEKAQALQAYDAAKVAACTAYRQYKQSGQKADLTAWELIEQGAADGATMLEAAEGKLMAASEAVLQTDI